VALIHGQAVIKIVCDTNGQRPDRFQMLGLCRPFDLGLAFGDVPRHGKSKAGPKMSDNPARIPPFSAPSFRQVSSDTADSMGLARSTAPQWPSQAGRTARTWQAHLGSVAPE
jgi:hypothetical protein